VGGREETKTRQKFGYQLVECRPLQITQKCYGVQGNTWAKTQPKHQNYRGEGLKIYTVAAGGFASSVKLLIELAVTSPKKLLLVMVLHSDQLVRLFFNVLLVRDSYTVHSHQEDVFKKTINFCLYFHHDDISIKC
jgi:hypothetical protein